MKIGHKLRQLRMANELTQEELASRTNLSKGFISQLESDIASPSIDTLADILEALGTNFSDFFNDCEQEKVVFDKKSRIITPDSDKKKKVELLIPAAGKRKMDPVLVSLKPGTESLQDEAHEGEEFGYLLEGTVELILDSTKYRLKKGDCFYFCADKTHSIQNVGQKTARILWIVTPPIF